jgi:hypothetical protein
VSTDPTPSGRALTPAQKRALIERLLVAWQHAPYLRLGQLLELGIDDLQNVEDDELVAAAERAAAMIPSTSG